MVRPLHDSEVGGIPMSDQEERFDRMAIIFIKGQEKGAGMTPQEIAQLRKKIQNEIYNAVADVLTKYQKEDGDAAFKAYIDPFALQLQMTGKLDCEEIA